MNFFGHAAVARAYEAAPDFVLGAMLPDFAGMLRVRAPGLAGAGIARGVALHHATDAAFHTLPAFLTLMARAQRSLGEAGVRRGPARAVAHVGVELLLDEVLVEEAANRTAFLQALRHANAARDAILWSTPTDAFRFAELVDVLIARGLSASRATPEGLTRRVCGALTHRPRLALLDQEPAAVLDWVVAARPDVVGWAPVIMTELESRLAAAGYPLA
ncbi:MAG TPA: hypothetical protein VER33_17170 [Polyangiaceae bacterium]|nr:hypothetical protein [Polyangiaceae bacterium]